MGEIGSNYAVDIILKKSSAIFAIFPTTADQKSMEKLGTNPVKYERPIRF